MAYLPGTQYVPKSIWENYSPPPQGAAIYSISGNMVDGNLVTIKGKGFGSGSKHMYENFSGFTSEGQRFDEVDNQFDRVSPRAKSVVDSRSGNYALDGYALHPDTGWYGGSPCDFSFGEKVTEVFASFSTKNPIGYLMPNNNITIPAPNTHSDGSNLKSLWIYDGDSGQGGDGNDIIVDMLNTGSFGLEGNDLTNYINNAFGQNPDAWTFGEWVRTAVWLRAGDVPNVDVTEYMFQKMNPTNGIYNTTPPTRDAVFENGTVPYQWDRFQIAAWARPFTLADNPTVDQVKLYFDDLYVAWGENAATRVELGDNANYGLCTKLSICDSALWDDGHITINVRESDLDFGGDVFLFVIGSDNTQLVARQVL